MSRRLRRKHSAGVLGQRGARCHRGHKTLADWPGSNELPPSQLVDRKGELRGAGASVFGTIERQVDLPGVSSVSVYELPRPEQR